MWKSGLMTSQASSQNLDLGKIGTTDEMNGPSALPDQAPIKTVSKQSTKRRLTLLNSADTGNSQERLYDIFHEQAQRTPDGICIEWCENKATWTFAQVEGAASAVAAQIATCGVVPGSVCGVFIERGPTAYIAMLGVLKSRSSYVPIDTAFPLERVRFTLSDAGTAMVLSTPTALQATGPLGFVTCILGPLEPSGFKSMKITGGLVDYLSGKLTIDRRLCYLIYTSGNFRFNLV